MRHVHLILSVQQYTDLPIDIFLDSGPHICRHLNRKWFGKNQTEQNISRFDVQNVPLARMNFVLTINCTLSSVHRCRRVLKGLDGEQVRTQFSHGTPSARCLIGPMHPGTWACMSLQVLHIDTILRWNISVNCVVATRSLILITLYC